MDRFNVWWIYYLSGGFNMNHCYLHCFDPRDGVLINGFLCTFSDALDLVKCTNLLNVNKDSILSSIMSGMVWLD